MVILTGVFFYWILWGIWAGFLMARVLTSLDWLEFFFWAFSSVAFGIVRDWLAGYELTKG